MTGLTAAHLGIKNRGTIQEGNIADLVLFDPKTVKDNSTIQDSKALSDGIQMVWVNGQLIYQKKKATGKLPGTLITTKN
jgi:N-acyl-D-aspartate/D-glutamate deacylase